MTFLVQFIVFEKVDSKQFVDKSLTKDFKEISEDFLELVSENNLDIEQMKKDFSKKKFDFKDDCFEKLRGDVNKFYENSFVNDPSEFDKAEVVQNGKPSWYENLSLELQSVAAIIFELWGEYGKTSTENLEARTTKIHIEGIFFVPGGRFNELYYWDSYWILIGLLESNMEHHALDLVKCFVYLINKFNFIPNGSRAYYAQRSQPPLFCQLLYRLYNNTDNQETKNYILTTGFEAAEKEYSFFMEKRKIKDAGYADLPLNQYFVDVKKPRYESYKEDFLTRALKKDDKDGEIYIELRSGAESGWDFSSRWNSGEDLSSIEISHIIPVCLNSFMLENERILAFFCGEKSTSDSSSNFVQKQEIYNQARLDRWNAMNKVLLNPKTKCWNDFNVKTGKLKSERFYFSNIMPLFYMEELKHDDVCIPSILLLYIDSLIGHVGGVPCSGKPLTEDKIKQQWDYPNVWAPHVQMLIEFLIKNGYEKMAYHAARSFHNSITSMKENGKVVFMEKYNCDVFGEDGRGGEYPVQEGFGWTNGTEAYIIKTYLNRLEEEFDHVTSFNTILEELLSMMPKPVVDVPKPMPTMQQPVPIESK